MSCIKHDFNYLQPFISFKIRLFFEPRTCEVCKTDETIFFSKNQRNPHLNRMLSTMHMHKVGSST